MQAKKLVSDTNVTTMQIYSRMYGTSHIHNAPKCEDVVQILFDLFSSNKFTLKIEIVAFFLQMDKI